MAARPARLALLFGALGCTHGPLLDTPVIGGTDEQHAAVVAQLEEFARYAGPDRTWVREIVFEPRDDMGSITRHTRRVSLAEDLHPLDVTWVMRHELCHALDFEEALVADPSDLFDRLTDGLFAPDAGFLSVEASGGYPTERARRSETLASFCSRGPLAAHATASPCGGDDPDLAALSDWLVRHVWTEPSATFTWDPEASARWTTSDPLVEITPAVADVPPSALRLEVSRQNATDPGYTVYASRWFDLPSGAPLKVDEAGVVFLDTVREVPPGLPAVLGENGAGYPEGPAVRFGRLEMYQLAPPLRFFLYVDGEWRAPEPGCWLDYQEFFTAEDRTWMAWADGNDVRWRALP